jgi:hypothetical protein
MRGKAQRAAGVLRRWDRSNSPDAQQRLVNGDPWRLWGLARDLAEALREVTGDHGAGPQTTSARTRTPSAAPAGTRNP